MSARTRGSTAVAVALTATLTAATAALLTGCGPTSGARAVTTPPAATGTPSSGSSAAPAGGATPSAGTAPSAGASTTPTGGSTPTGTPTTAGSTRAPVLNGTANSGLTISDGTRYVVMNGTRVDFGTAVRDLAWSPDGRKAAFIDGAGNLAVANPNGTGRVTVARNPGGQNWSHPTWQVTAYDSIPELSGRSNILFAVRKSGVSELDSVPSSAVNGTPKKLGLGWEAGDGVKPVPQTGNVWPSAGGTHGGAVYANSGTGEVFIRDDYVRQQGSALTHGSQPAMSHSEHEEVVFVRSVGGHDHLFLESPTDAGPVFKDLTPYATTDYTEPAWAPDGSTIAARTPAGIVTLSTKSSAAPKLVSTYTGLPSYRG
ncbi:hypothetical protein G3I60_31140 [Streptomyces sp. SID13666]|uniref:PD40 domain-containing protein n=1 Tax=unclassified Streptomyces TaxID=2593676 RepID=UPI0013BEDEE9|nr:MULTISPECIES: PD40 domain-containing protein [unclassified Streptomyces]NEA58486.1 hypothetical protein [Streptomyces sp. SID13666]NEA72525.1 hypothetical protein [Streptomyces sp. SID13588]